MLAERSENTNLVAALQDPRLEFILPDELVKKFANQSGYAATTADEQRARARLWVQRCADIAFVDPADRHSGLNQKAFVKDLSRSGIAIIYHKQIFPEDVIRLTFQHRIVTAIVVRCRKLGVNCFETGARILEMESEDDT